MAQITSGPDPKATLTPPLYHPPARKGVLWSSATTWMNVFGVVDFHLQPIYRDARDDPSPVTVYFAQGSKLDLQPSDLTSPQFGQLEYISPSSIRIGQV